MLNESYDSHVIHFTQITYIENHIMTSYDDLKQNDQILLDYLFSKNYLHLLVGAMRKTIHNL